MKSYIKKRKHRNGVRPQRKGTLKVRMVTLPTCLDHTSTISRLLIQHNQTQWGDDFPSINATQAEWDRYHYNFQRRKDNLTAITKMQSGYDFFMNFEQVKASALALNVINEVDPVYEKPFNVYDRCKSCEYKDSCPFEHHSKKMLLLTCPFIRASFRHQVLSSPVSLTTTEMAEIAMKHLS
jgi:hypothetical protein